jgi:hypothetical protein
MYFCTRMEYAKAEATIRTIIDAHTALAKEYKRMMTDIENNGLFFYHEKKAAKSDATDRRRIVLGVLNTMYILYVCQFLGPATRFKVEKAYIFRPYVKYILSNHIRRQYQKLYNLYLAEIVTHRKNIPKEDVDELRQIASDIRDYSITLPSLKSLTALLLAALSIMGTLFGIFDVKVPLDAVFSKSALAEFLSLFLIYSLGFGIALSPLIAAFHFKRFLFKDNKHEDVGYWPSSDLSDMFKVNESGDVTYFPGSGPANPIQLYNSSIYRTEDQLFELLGGKEQKPKEISIDIIFRVALGSFYCAVFIMNTVINSADFEDLQTFFGFPIHDAPIVNFIYRIVITLAPSGVLFYLLPIADYKKRVKARLA